MNNSLTVRPKAGRYWQEGARKKGWLSASAALFLVYVTAIAFAAASNFSLAGLAPWQRAATVVTALLVSVLPILFWWRQSWHFETWILYNPLNLSVTELEFEKTRFKTNSDFARAFWSALVVVFTGLLITSALKAPSAVPITLPSSVTKEATQ
jgi:hypothetical protein